MNPDTNKFEQLIPAIAKTLGGGLPDTERISLIGEIEIQQQQLLRPNGEPVPQHWTQFRVGEHVVIKNYTFKVAYIGETAILFEPVGIADLKVK